MYEKDPSSDARSEDTPPSPTVYALRVLVSECRLPVPYDPALARSFAECRRAVSESGVRS
jgi:hypothetical protein